MSLTNDEILLKNETDVKAENINEYCWNSTGVEEQILKNTPKIVNGNSLQSDRKSETAELPILKKGIPTFSEDKESGPTRTRRNKTRNFDCRVCQYSTSKKANLILHLKSKHIEHSAFVCQHCAYSTPSKGALNRHVNIKHDLINKFKCNGCKYLGATKSNLISHLKNTLLLTKRTGKRVR